jgi:hypothetical protein
MWQHSRPAHVRCAARRCLRSSPVPLPLSVLPPLPCSRREPPQLLYARKDQRKPALMKFKQALELSPHLREAWIAQAQVFQQVTLQ